MNKTLIFAVLGGAVSVAAVGGGTAYYMANRTEGPSAENIRAAEAAERERYAREEEINHATVFSYVQGKGRASQPVMVTLHLAGTRGFGAFCGRIPLVEETVLRALAAGGIEARIGESVNGVLAGKPVRDAKARLLTDPAAAGLAARETEKKCLALAKAEAAAKKAAAAHE